MPRFVRRSTMPVSAEALHAWHAAPGAFERLTPAWQPAHVVSRSGGITDGSRVVLDIPVLGGLVTQRWSLEHRDHIAGRQFRDVQLAGPFATWSHLHRFEPIDATSSVLADEIDYALPLGPLGQAAAGWYVADSLERLFVWRHARTLMDLRRHAAVAGLPPLHVAITGGTGMIGRALTGFLRMGGHCVRWITRSPDASRGDIGWDPAAGTIDTDALEGVDAVVHLAGANVGERWTAAHKRAIRDSREQGTRTIARAIAGMAATPRVFISGSAIGLYGDTGDRTVDETTPPGTGFLGEVAQTWEREAEPAAAAGVRTCIARIGVVLAAEGGALARMLPAFQAGVGGPLGSGRQWMSWVSLDDVIGAIHHLLLDDTLTGPFNVVAPAPVTNAEFVATLGRVLRRPTVLPVPAFALTALFGEMAEATILGGQRVLPARLTAAGFSHEHPTLDAALRFELGRAG